MLFHAFFGFVTQCPVFCNFRCVCVCFRRLVERLENMRRSAVGNGLSQCLLCGEVFGLLSSPSVLCLDCCMKVCTKCGIETAGSQKRAQWLCKICSERREDRGCPRQSEGHLGRLRPGCMGPVQRNTRSRGGGRVSGALYTYLGLVRVSPGCFLSALFQLGLFLHQVTDLLLHGLQLDQHQKHLKRVLTCTQR
uniref:Rabphilin 3A-like (without C2 domains) n=1 Tax=Cyprinus carpio TaxID=7962 RepID=A0A8C1ZDP0_CYPCA